MSKMKDMTLRMTTRKRRKRSKRRAGTAGGYWTRATGTSMTSMTKWTTEGNPFGGVPFQSRVLILEMERQVNMAELEQQRATIKQQRT